MPAIAVANNDYVHLAWDFGDTEIPGCIGFAIDRFTPGGASEGTPLQVFAGHDNNGAEKFVSCRERPITKFQWRDVFAKPEEVYWYRVVPMQQGAAKPEPIPSIAAAETGKVTVSEDAGNAKVYFNRGILATQKVAQALWDAKRRTPNRDLIEEAISDPDTPLRKSLAHELFKALTSLLRRAQDGGSCYAALYELTDDALVRELAACKNLHLILSNNNDEDSEKDADGKIKKVVLYDRKNEKAAKTLQGTAKQLIRRYLPQGQIGHNKFMVYCDPAGEARAVLTGSTNWTPSGLCTQSNNAIVIESPTLANQYLRYWKDLANDVQNIKVPLPAAPMKGIQGKALRTNCNEDILRGKALPLNQGGTVQVCFSPNTPSILRSGEGKPPPSLPSDLRLVYDALEGAEQSVLFLAFMPGAAGAAGSYHFLKKLAEIAGRKPALFIRGAVSDPGLATEFSRALFASPENEDAMIVSPAGIISSLGLFEKEIYKYGHAVIHDKTIVVDPFSDNCVVFTGSHNLGYRASFNNDENLLVIRGDRAIASMYAAHIMDVMEHYRSRWFSSQTAKAKALREAGGDAKTAAKRVAAYYHPGYTGEYDPDWQKRYFQEWRIAFTERKFWLSNGAPLPKLTAPPAASRNARAGG